MKCNNDGLALLLISLALLGVAIGLAVHTGELSWGEARWWILFPIALGFVCVATLEISILK